MRKRFSLWALCFGIVVWLNACAILNPYDEEFLCPDGYPGDCASVKEAYERSLYNSDESFSPMVKNKKASPDDPADGGEERDREQYRYKAELYKEMAGLISSPATPVLMPSKQRRVLITNYVDENNYYYGHRFVYFTSREATWSMQPFNEAEPLGD
jgi:conjugal transfer pilus assembly protein TraV